MHGLSRWNILLRSLILLIQLATTSATISWNTTLPLGSGKPLSSDLQSIFGPYLNLTLSASCHAAYYALIECDSILQDIGDDILAFASSDRVSINSTDTLSISESDLDIICRPSCSASLKVWEDGVHKACLGSQDSAVVHQWLGIAWIDLAKTFCLKNLQSQNYCLVEGDSFASFIPGTSSSSIDIDLENTSSACNNSCEMQQLSLYHNSMPKMFQDPSTLCPGLNMTGYPQGYVYQTSIGTTSKWSLSAVILIPFTLLVMFLLR